MKKAVLNKEALPQVSSQSIQKKKQQPTLLSFFGRQKPQTVKEAAIDIPVAAASMIVDKLSSSMSEAVSKAAAAAAPSLPQITLVMSTQIKE